MSAISGNVLDTKGESLYAMHMGNRLCFILIVIVSAFLLVGCGKSTRGTAGDTAAAQALVDEATQVLGEALEKDEKGTLKEPIARAKGVMIIPAIGDVSFIFSIGGGNVIMLANTDTCCTGPEIGRASCRERVLR